MLVILTPIVLMVVGIPGQCLSFMVGCHEPASLIMVAPKIMDEKCKMMISLNDGGEGPKLKHVGLWFFPPNSHNLSEYQNHSSFFTTNHSYSKSIPVHTPLVVNVASSKKQAHLNLAIPMHKCRDFVQKLPETPQCETQRKLRNQVRLWGWCKIQYCLWIAFRFTQLNIKKNRKKATFSLFTRSKEPKLVGGFNPFENMLVKMGRGETKTYLKPPPRKQTLCS